MLFVIPAVIVLALIAVLIVVRTRRGPVAVPKRATVADEAPAFGPGPAVQTTVMPTAAPAPVAAAIPAAWHPDPSGRHQLRYWDGALWTAHVSDGGQTATDPL